jgi:hypothetical protein
MQTKKLNLSDLQQQLSRVEMKQIKAGNYAGLNTCAPAREKCPNPDGTPDGCCGSCKPNSVGIKLCY